jgi:N-carbamoylputrescine amidase
MAYNSLMRIGLIQHACGEQASANIDSAVDMIRDAAGQGARLIVTQELFVSRYFPQVEDERHFALAETIPGPTSERLSALARELGVAISASLFEKRTAGIYHNTSVMIDRTGRLTGMYRKMHIPDDPRFYEKYYFTPGDLGFAAHQLHEGRVGMLVCWDQWFPEAARLTALHGAEVLLYPTAIGWHHTTDGGGETVDDRRRQCEAWQTVQRSHAITNGVYVVAVNRVGIEDELMFWGGSFVADPSGQVVAEAPRNEPAVLVVDCDLSMIESWRKGWPFLRDRRVDSYHDLAQRYLDGSA